MGKLTERIRDTEAEISSASMADIAFLLIIFFMVTTVFSATKGLDFKLPSDEDQAQTATEEEEAIYFKVLASGQILMDGQPAEPGDIIEYVLPKLENWPDKPIIIYSEPDAPYRGMVQVYDQLMRAAKPKGEAGGLGLLTKAPNISIPTQSEVQRYIELFGYNPFEKS